MYLGSRKRCTTSGEFLYRTGVQAPTEKGVDMEYNSESINALSCAIDDMKTASLIYVDKKLRAVLKCLAYYQDLRRVLTACSKGFDYGFEKEVSFGRMGDNYVLRLPGDDRKLVALVTNLLVEFDAGTADLYGFVVTFFPASAQQESFDKFYRTMMEPFKLAVVRFVKEGVEEQPDAPVERDVKFASTGLQKRTEYLIYNISKAVHEFNGDARNDCIVMLEGLASAIDSRDSLMIRAMWIGLRRTLESEGLCAKERAEFDGVLKMYMMTK